MTWPQSSSGFTLLLAVCGIFACSAYAQDAKAPISYVPLSSKKVEQQQTSVTVTRVRPPMLPKIARIVQPVAPTAEELADAERLANKPYDATVFTVQVQIGKHTLSELHWQRDGVRYVAYSNVDFRLLTEPATYETEHLVVSWFPFVMPLALGDPGELTEEMRLARAGGLELGSAIPDFVLVGEAAKLPHDDVTLLALDCVHAHFATNRADLESRFIAREELAAERERLRQEQPKTKRKMTVRFWPANGGGR